MQLFGKSEVNSLFGAPGFILTPSNHQGLVPHSPSTVHSMMFRRKSYPSSKSRRERDRQTEIVGERENGDQKGKWEMWERDSDFLDCVSSHCWKQSCSVKPVLAVKLSWREFETQLWHKLPAWPRTRHRTPLSFSFSIHQIGVITPGYRAVENSDAIMYLRCLALSKT